jgi:hypothetical protein
MNGLCVICTRRDSYLFFCTFYFQNTERISINFGKPTSEANTKVDLNKGIDCENMNWICLAVDRNGWRFLANTERNI